MFFHSIPKWPAVFWSIINIVSVDTSYGKWHLIYSALLAVSCVYNIFVTPQVTCSLESHCDDSLSVLIKTLFIRIMASTCLVSRLVIILKGRSQLAQYKTMVEKFHVLTPMTVSETEVLNKLASRLVVSCLLLTAPIYFLRVRLLSRRNVDFTLFSLVLIYVQNTSMYCVDIHFTFLCFDLYQKFVGINRDLLALKVDTILRNRYPFVSRTGEKYSKNCDAAVVDYNVDVSRSLDAGHPMTNYVEQLKIKHQLVREAVKNLNDLFGVHLGLSLCSLCLYAIFELYYNMVRITNVSEENIHICGWILQYAVRFCSITILAHLTPKQALKSKILITDINNRHLDKNTKEELRLFLNQIASSSIEFTACDFFTLNTHLITSAIAAGTTYLVMLLQFNSWKT